VTIALANPAGVAFWFLTAIGTDETNTVAAINATLSINQTNKTATFTAPGTAGSAVIFQSTVGVSSTSAQGFGRDVNGVVQPTWTTTFKVNVLTSNLQRVIAVNETTEQDPTFGYTSVINNFIRNPATIGASQRSTAVANGLNSNVATSGNSTLRLTGPTATFSIGGFAPSTAWAAGQIITVINTTSQAMTIVNEDTSSTATNRITVASGGANYVFLEGHSTAICVYDGTTSRWVLQNPGVKYPTFYDIRQYGAKCDGTTDDGPAINAAIAACAAAGGGEVFIPLNVAIATQITIGGPAATTVNGVTLRGPSRPTDKSVTLKWIGSAHAGPMLLLESTYGSGVSNLGFDARGLANYCIQSLCLSGDIATEHLHAINCYFANAAVYNEAIGNATPTASTGDVSCFMHQNCLYLQWEGQVSPEPQTSAHLYCNSDNALGNTWIGCQFSGSDLDNPSGKVITSISTANPAVVVCTGHGFTAGQTAIFQGTGIVALDVGTNGPDAVTPYGFAVTVVDANTFTVPVSGGIGYSGSGAACWKLGYPNFGVIVAAGRSSFYNCIDVGLGVCFCWSPTPTSGSIVPGGASFYEHESQSANWLWVDQQSTGAGQWPFVMSGVHQSDIWGYGTYSVSWNRSPYCSTLAIVGGNLYRGVQNNVSFNGLTILGTIFPIGGYQVSGAFSSLVNGWWLNSGGAIVSQLPPATIGALTGSTFAGTAVTASTEVITPEVIAAGSTLGLGYGAALALTLQANSGYVSIVVPNTKAGLIVDASGSSGLLVGLKSGTSGNAYLDADTSNFRHGNSGNQFLTVSDATASPYSGGVTDALLFGAVHLYLASTSGTNIWCNGHSGFSVNSSGSIGFYGATPRAQATRVGQLTDSTTGSAGSTVTDVGSSFNQATLDNNFASLIAKINALELIIHNLGLST
jgi:hypothetical protein